jgi:hypothetical protein
VRHEAPGVPGGGERPSLLGRRSGLMKRRASRSPGTAVIGGKRPQEGEPCRYCQTVRLVERGQKVQRERISAGRSVTAKPAPTWWIWAGVQCTNPGMGSTPKPFSSSGEATVTACGVAVAMLPVELGASLTDR